MNNKYITSQKKALSWLKTNTINHQGIITTSEQRVCYNEVTGYLIPTLIDYGEISLASQYANYLKTVQNPNGSFNGVDGKEYVFDTGQVLRGLIKMAQKNDQYINAATRASEYISTRIQGNGRIQSDWEGIINENVHVYILPALLEAGQFLDNQLFYEKAMLSLDYYKKNFSEEILHDELTHFSAYIIDGFLDMGEIELIKPQIEYYLSMQKKDGSLPGKDSVYWVCSTGLAQLAVIGYKLNYEKESDLFLEHLIQIQNPSGGFFGSYGKDSNYFPYEEISWSVKYFLDAILEKQRTYFNLRSNIFPENLSNSDGRLLYIIDSISNFSDKRRKVLDIGCGTGRFSSKIREYNPQLSIHGVDISEKLLSKVPEGIKTKEGNVLNIPYKDESFDIIICVEALEHSLNPQNAINEMLRVLMKNGKIIIIDKNIEKLGTMEISPFEQWFDKDLIIKLLQNKCTKVKCTSIAYDNYLADGLFLAWEGTKL